MNLESDDMYLIYLGNIDEIEDDLEKTYNELRGVIQSLSRTKQNLPIIEAFNKHNNLVDAFNESLISAPNHYQ